MSKHTSRICHPIEGHKKLQNLADALVCDIISRSDVELALEVIEDNRQLLQAAPLLLEALVEMEGYGDANERISPLWDRARAAIKAATE